MPLLQRATTEAALQWVMVCPDPVCQTECLNRARQAEPTLPCPTMRYTGGRDGPAAHTRATARRRNSAGKGRGMIAAPQEEAPIYRPTEVTKSGGRSEIQGKSGRSWTPWPVGLARTPITRKNVHMGTAKASRQGEYTDIDDHCCAHVREGGSANSRRIPNPATSDHQVA